MPHAVTIIRERQRAIRREIDRRAISLKAVAHDAQISYETLLSYFPGGDRDPANIPASAIFCLCGALPADLLSLLLPDTFAVVRVPEGIDHDEFDQMCRDYVSAKAAAHHPESEAGREIGPTEDATLTAKVVALRAA